VTAWPVSVEGLRLLADPACEGCDIAEVLSRSRVVVATMLLPEHPIPGVSRKTFSQAALLTSRALRSLSVP